MKNYLLSNFIYMLVVLFLFGCTTRNIVKVKTSFINDTNQVSNLSGPTTIYFENGFNDTLMIFLNKKLIEKGFYKTQINLGYTGKSIKINPELIKSNKQRFDLKYGNEKNVGISIIEGYKIIEISKSESNWIVIYSNRGPVFE